MVSQLHRIWNRAKVGTKIWLGPITLHIRLGRTVAVSRNTGRAPVPIQSAKSIPLRRSNAISPVDQRTSDEQSSEPWQRSTHRPETALIVGTGPGLGSSLARRFAKAGMTVAVASRNTKKLDGLLSELQMLGSSAHSFGCDATNERSVRSFLPLVTSVLGAPDLVVYNVEHHIPGTILDIKVAAFEECWRAMTLGGILVGREAARSMAPRGKGTIIYTGATESSATQPPSTGCVASLQTAVLASEVAEINERLLPVNGLVNLSSPLFDRSASQVGRLNCVRGGRHPRLK